MQRVDEGHFEVPEQRTENGNQENKLNNFKISALDKWHFDSFDFDWIFQLLSFWIKVFIPGRCAILGSEKSDDSQQGR